MEYTDIELPWGRTIKFPRQNFPNLSVLLSSDFCSDNTCYSWMNGSVAARWFSQQVALEEMAGKLIKLLGKDPQEDEDSDQAECLSKIVDWDYENEDMPQEVLSVLSEAEVATLRDFWQDAMSDWDISQDPHGNAESLMVRRGAWRGTFEDTPDTVGELIELLKMVDPDTPLTSEDGLRLERVGNFAVVDFSGEADKDNVEETCFQDLAQDAPALVG